MQVYEGNRAPFGLNMHAAWFFTEANLKAMHRFIERLLQENDIYIISAKRVLDWMRKPVKVSICQVRSICKFIMLDLKLNLLASVLPVVLCMRMQALVNSEKCCATILAETVINTTRLLF